MSNKSASMHEVISLPKGGGALHGIGEKFSPDLHTGTGNFTIPIALPPGRNGFQPQLNLVYSTGNGNGFFGLGWNLSIPGVSRKTSKGIPRYDDASDVFILSGAEDLVSVESANSKPTRYQPRTEGLFARILHHREANDNYWEVHSKDGLVSYYGTPGQGGSDSAVISKPNPTDPNDHSRIFAWKLTLTQDPFGNRIEYIYDRDKSNIADHAAVHQWDQPLLKQIRYIDYTGPQGDTQFLMNVTFNYEERGDPFSEYRAGFEIRTTQICKSVLIETHPTFDPTQTLYSVRKYEFDYDNHALNGASLLSQVRVIGFDDAGTQHEELPPLTFGYTQFEPQERKFSPVTGADLPPYSLANPDLDLVDLTGDGLPDILQMNGVVRYWRNLGSGVFDLPRPMRDAPPFALVDQGVQIIDANGDGRADLLVTTAQTSGYFPLQFDGQWSRKSFRRYSSAPSFSLEDPEVKLIDLDGDGVTDAIRSSTRLECFFNDPYTGWRKDNTRWVERRQLADFPNVNFSDPRVKWGDMTGDGLQDIVLIYDGNVEYWSNMGHGDWSRRIHMRNSPRFQDFGYTFGYDPRRILLGDVDGDGCADIVYVDDCKVTLWINQSGNRWSEPIVIQGTPPVTDLDSIRLVDLLGTGISGVLWSADASSTGRRHMFFLDFTGGIKPYLLNQMDNHLGAVTQVEYKPSTHFYLQDRKNRSPWRTPLPFPVQVVARVEVIDELSKGKLTTEYKYHHGYWDGAEREFLGFGMVEQLDTESFENFNAPGLHGQDVAFNKIKDREHFAPPTLTKTWFHQGAVGEEFGDWQELDLSSDYWADDPPALNHTKGVNDFLTKLNGNRPTLTRRMKRDALRSLRGSILRTELYALDGAWERAKRPYTVTESAYEVREESVPSQPSSERLRIFFPHVVAQRTTQWERGSDPMTQFAFTGEYDSYGQPHAQITIAVPRKRQYEIAIPAGQPAPEPYLATHTLTDYAKRDDDDHYIVDRVARTTTYEIKNDGRDDLTTLKNRIETKSLDLPENAIGQTINYYDGAEFVGLNFGNLGDYGALTRSENLVLTEEILGDAYRTGDSILTSPEEPPYFARTGTPTWTAEYPQAFRNALPSLVGYVFCPGGQPNATDARGFFTKTERRSYDFQRPDSNGKGRGLVMAQLDPLDHQTSILYDYELLPKEVRNAVGLTTKAAYNYRVLQPFLVTDPNGNQTEFCFSPMGLLQETWVRGHPNKTEGDRQRPSVTMEYDLRAFVDSKQQDPFDPKPIFVRTIRQVHHDTETNVIYETIETREYSDGFGRLLQTRTQAEDYVLARSGVASGQRDLTFGDDVLPEQQSDPGGDVVAYAVTDPANKPRVVVSGWQTYDNKGRVIEKYEPFFAEGWDYAAPVDAQQGQKVTMYYDPRGQVIRTVNPDGSEQRVIYGVPGTITSPNLENPTDFEPTPWEAYTYDANDNAGRTHPATAKDYRHHWNTPSNIVLDALGRTVLAIQRNRAKPASRTDPLPPVEEYRTRSTFDIRGNLLTVVDPLGRVAFRHVYDLANRPLRVASIDAGVRRSVLDAAGNVVEQRDSKGALILHAYDLLNRPTRLWARDNTNSVVTLRELLTYGDDMNAGLSQAQVFAGNLLGKLYRHDDEAGRLSLTAYDFKGNVLNKERQVIADSEILAALDSTASGGIIKAFRVDWDSPPVLEGSYETAITYDALNRVKSMQYPKDVDGEQKTLTPHYNRSGALERVELDDNVYVERIAYNAKRQRTLIAYGNGVMTRYTYDEHTFRLVRLRTERFTHRDPLTYHPDSMLPIKDRLLQDLAYEYDLVGNITEIHDRASRSGVINTPSGKDALDRTFGYDPIYRLIFATGRECNTIPKPRPWTEWRDMKCGYYDGNVAAPSQDNAPNLTAIYWENYSYDPAGNMTALAHGHNGNPDWTRHFGMGGFTPQQWEQEWRTHLNTVVGWSNPSSNRLTHLGDDQPRVLQNHFYDDNGNLIRENVERHFRWDHNDRLIAFANQPTPTSPSSVEACYLYDARGQRVKKYVRNQQGHIEAAVRIDDIFEYHFNSKDGWTNNSLHIMDNQSRIAILRVGNAFSDDGAPNALVKYHLGDHLGSSSVVIGGTTTVANGFINCEEYFPYGETSLGSFARKRYRFTGKERDEESGLYYHGARYYAPWITRWTSPDPARRMPFDPNKQMGSGNLTTDLYQYVRENPLRLIDPWGLQERVYDDDALEEARAIRGWQSQNTKEGLKTVAETVEPILELHPLIATSELATGESPVTQRKLPWWERLLNTPFLGAAVGMVVGKGAKLFAKTLGKVENLGNILEKATLTYLHKRGDKVLGIGDQAVKEALNIAEVKAKHPELGLTDEVADFLSATEAGKFNITEVKEALGTAGADIDKALSQLENTLNALKAQVPDAKIGKLEIVVPEGAKLKGGYSISGSQLVHITEEGTEVIRIDGNVVHVTEPK